MERHKVNKEKSTGMLKSLFILGSILLPCLLLLGIFMFIEIISYNHNQAYDVTPEKKFTLSSQAKQVLDSLDNTLYLKTFYGPGEREKYDIFYKIISSYSSKIKYELIDLDRNPGKARVFNAGSPGCTIIEYKGKTYTVKTPTEESVINAFLQLSRTRQKFIYILKGHGEREDIETLKENLKHENWKIENIYMNDLAKAPRKDNAVLMIAGIQNDFSENEIVLIEKYLNSGGKAVILLEPFIKIPNLKAFIEKCGIGLPEEIIIDQKNKLFGGDYLAPLIPYYADAAVVSQVTMPSFFSTARPAEIMNPGNSDGVSVKTLASSSEHSWSKKNREDVMKGRIDYIEGVDRPGPVPVAAMVTMPGKTNDSGLNGWEMICFGDSDFIRDSLIENMGNRDLFLNTVEWLARDYDLISIRQKLFKYPYQFLSNQQGMLLFSVPVIVLPFIFLLTSIAVYFYRRIRG
jgi:hypothetical protein